MSNRASAIWQLSLMRARLFYREPAAMFWSFGFPVLLTIALGVAFRNQKPDPVRVAIESNGEAAHALELLSRRSDINARVLDRAEASEALRTGKVGIVVVPQEHAHYTYRFDPTRPESRLARAVVDDAIERGEGRVDSATAVDALVTEAGSRYIDFLVPGLIGIGLMSSGLWGVGFALTEMRTKKLLKRFVATPMKKSEFLASFLIIRALFVLAEVPPLLLFARAAFDVRIHGSWALVAIVTLAGTMTFAGLGLLVAVRTSNSQVAQGLINAISLPMYMCSGVFFTADRFPPWSQPIVRALPLTALNDALRDVITDGAGVNAIATPLAIVAAWGVAAFAIALRLFRWK